jgi:hypothetical protein
MTLDAVAYNERSPEKPDDASAHAKIGQALLPLGDFRKRSAPRAAIRLIDDDKPHYDLGSLYLQFNRLAEPDEFEAVLQLSGGLSGAATWARSITSNRITTGPVPFESALRLSPTMQARRNLDLVRSARRALKRQLNGKAELEPYLRA